MNFSALRHRDFRLFLGGQLVSMIGTWMQSVGQAWLVLELTRSPFSLGLVSALQFIPVLFPEGSLTEKSKAKPEVWQKWPEFEAAAKKLQTESEKLRDSAKAKNAQQTQDIVKDFGRNACGACHTPFRVPPARTS